MKLRQLVAISLVVVLPVLVKATAPHPVTTRVTPTPTPTPVPTLRGIAVPRASATPRPTAVAKKVAPSRSKPTPTLTPHSATAGPQVVIARARPVATATPAPTPHASVAPQQALHAKPIQPTPAPSAAPAFASQQPLPFPLVDIKKTEPTIIVDLRYATPDNFAHRAIYPPDARAMTRPEVMQRLVAAQRYLRRYEFNLKIWDAYRPRWAQIELWQASPKNDYVANPDAGAGSLHSWGLAVDATLGDRYGGNVKMPTEFDDFTPAAMWKYTGPNDLIRRHLAVLQSAMASAGFYGVRSEWWHFTSEDWQQLMPPDEVKRAVQAFSAAEHKKL